MYVLFHEDLLFMYFLVFSLFMYFLCFMYISLFYVFLCFTYFIHVGSGAGSGIHENVTFSCQDPLKSPKIKKETPRLICSDLRLSN